MSRDEMSALQGKRLNKLVNLVYHNVPFYRNKMQELSLIHISEPTRQAEISYAVFCLKKKKKKQ